MLTVARGNPLLHAVVSATHGADTDLLPLLTTHSHSLLTVAKAVILERIPPYDVPLAGEQPRGGDRHDRARGAQPRHAAHRVAGAHRTRPRLDLRARPAGVSAPGRAGTVRLGTTPGRAVVAAAVLGSGMVLLDGTVVNVALRTVGADLGASLAELQWVTNGYLLSLASLILLGGALGDRYGRRRVFLVGTGWFALASLLCGVAPTPTVLIAARVLQGVGAALLTPGSLAMIQGAFVREDRARAIGSWSGLGSIAGALGPFVGGALVQYASWRWIFLVNLPVAAVTLLVARRWVPETRDPGPPPRFDPAGAALAALALGGTTYALVEWGTGAAPYAAGGAVLAAAGSSSPSGAARTRCCRWGSSPTAPSPPPTS